MIVKEREVIPTYTLEEGSTISSSMFEIIETHGEFRKRKANFLIPHRKDYYMLVFVREGSSRHWVDFVPYTLKPNTFYFSNPNQVQIKEQSAPLHGILISFTKDFLQIEENLLLRELPVILNPDNQHELSLTPEEIDFIEDLLEKMLTEFNTEKNWRSPMLQSYLRVLLIYVSRIYTKQFQLSASSDRVLLRKYRLLIDEHFLQHRQVNDYASMLLITPGHLNEIVKNQSGRSAIEHIHERIILEAKRHLLHGEYSVKEIAFMLGFDDAPYFNRFFKRITGQTPVAYRETIREMYH
jgi:AraC family transcriptional activator of pobA